MLSNAKLFTSLLGDLGLEDANHGEPDIPDRICQAVQAGLQNMYVLGPKWIRKASFSFQLFQPRDVSGMAMTQGETAFAGGNLTPAMVGCAIRIAGEPAFNRITSWDATAQTGTLLEPLQEVATSVGGTVYCDAVTLPAPFLSMTGGLYADGSYCELQPLFYEEMQIYKELPGRLVDRWGLEVAIMNQIALGRPMGYWIEPCSVQTTGVLLERLRLWPAPLALNNLRLRGEIGAPIVQTTDFTGGAAATTYIPVPLGMHETILLPLARLNLATDRRFSETARETLEPESAVMQRLAEMKPQRQVGQQMRPPYALPNGGHHHRRLWRA